MNCERIPKDCTKIRDPFWEERILPSKRGATRISESGRRIKNIFLSPIFDLIGKFFDTRESPTQKKKTIERFSKSN